MGRPPSSCTTTGKGGGGGVVGGRGRWGVGAGAWALGPARPAFTLVPSPALHSTLGTNGEHLMAALWGHLACEILMQRWDGALADLNRLREDIDADGAAPPAVALQRRVWLMHWALFVYFNHEQAREGWSVRGGAAQPALAAAVRAPPTHPPSPPTHPASRAATPWWTCFSPTAT